MKHLRLAILTILITSCAAPGVMSPKSNTSWSGETIYFSDGNLLEIKEINNINVDSLRYIEEEYVISAGDKLNVTVWGYPEVFPVLNYSADNPLNTRTVKTDGMIYFPYVGNSKS